MILFNYYRFLLSKSLPIRVNFAFLFISTLVNAIGRYGILLCIIKLAGVEEMGYYTLSQAICFPVLYLIDFNLSTVYITDYKNNFSLETYVSLRILTSFLLIIIIFFLTFSIGYNIYISTVLIFFSISTAILSFREIIISIPIKRENTFIVSISWITLAILSFLGFLFSLYISPNISYALLCLISIRTLIILFFDLPNAKSFYKTFSVSKALYSTAPSLLYKLSVFAAPAGFSVFLASFTINFPIIIFQYYYGTFLTGILGGINILSPLMQLLLNPLFSVTGYKLSYFFNESRKDFFRLFTRLNILFFIFIFSAIPFIMVFSGLFLSIFTTKDYLPYTQDFIYISCVSLLEIFVHFFDYVLKTMGFYRHVFVIRLILSLTSITTSFALIPPFGIKGIIYCRIITWFIGLTLLLYFIFFLNKKQINET